MVALLLHHCSEKHPLIRTKPEQDPNNTRRKALQKRCFEGNRLANRKGCKGVKSHCSSFFDFLMQLVQQHLVFADFD